VSLRDCWAQENALIDEIALLLDLYVSFSITHPMRQPFCGHGRATADDDHVDYDITLGREVGCVTVTFTFTEGDGTFLYASDAESDGESYGAMKRLARKLDGRLVAVNWKRASFTIEIYSIQLAKAQDAVLTDR
jgi:hypothetical protein